MPNQNRHCPSHCEIATKSTPVHLAAMAQAFSTICSRQRNNWGTGFKAILEPGKPARSRGRDRHISQRGQGGSRDMHLCGSTGTMYRAHTMRQGQSHRVEVQDSLAPTPASLLWNTPPRATTERRIRERRADPGEDHKVQMKDWEFPPYVWGDLFFTATCLCNRLPH